MKKLMYLLPFAALAMASCSSSEDVAQNVQTPSQELKFFTAVQGNTRGVVETTASLSKFNVILNGNFATQANGSDAAVQTTPAILVNKDGANWKMATQYYWGDATTAGKFTAWANTDVTPASGILNGIEVATNVNNQKDILVAYNEGNKTAFTAGVPLHFRHAMSQIVVKASYNDNEDAELLSQFPTVSVKVKGVKFVNLKNTGNLALPTVSTAAGQDYTPAWSGHAGSETFAVDLTSAVPLGSTATAIDLSESANPLLLLPQATTGTTVLPNKSTEAGVDATIAGAYIAVLVDIDYKVAQGTDGSKNIDLYPARPSGESGNQEAGSNTFAWVAVPVTTDWKPGSKYIYTLNFSNIALGNIAPGTEDGAIPAGKYTGNPLPAALLTPVNFLVTVEDEWTEYNATPAF